MADGILIQTPITEHQATHLVLLLDLKLECSQNLRSTKSKHNYILGSDTSSEVLKQLKNLIVAVKYDSDSNNRYTLTIRGSIHVFHHGKNDCDFLPAEMIEAKNKIYEIFRMDTVEIYPCGEIKTVNQIDLFTKKAEFGINFDLVGDEINLHQFLHEQLILHRKKPFILNKDGKVFECDHENYFWKIYVKGENLIRVEIVLRSLALRKFKIATLADALSPDKIIPILKWLKLEFSEIIFSDGINIHTCEGLSKKEELKLLRFTNDWRNRQYLFDQKKLKAKPSKKETTSRESKNLYQKMWRLGSSSREIFKEKSKGYKSLLIGLVNEKLDSLINQCQNTVSDIENVLA